MKECKKTKEDYNKGVDWHIQKSYSYDWRKQLDRFIERLHGNQVLDAGCGGGRDIAEFIKRGINVEGLDYSHKTIKKCSEKFPGVMFYEGDIRKMNVQDHEYNGLWACASLLNIEKSEVLIVLSEFRRVLKTDGILFISVKEGKGEEMIADQAGERFFSFYSADELKSLVEKAGFKVMKIQIVPDADLTGKLPKQANPSWICLYAVNFSKSLIS